MVVDDLSCNLDAITHRAKDVHDRTPDGALAAPGLAYQPERLALVEFKAHAIDGFYLRNFSR